MSHVCGRMRLVCEKKYIYEDMETDMCIKPVCHVCLLWKGSGNSEL